MSLSFPVLHLDSDVLVVAKPPGLAVIPARGEDPGLSLVKRLELERSEKLFVVHRIDRECSGVVLFARHAEAHRQLSLAFEKRLVHKLYLAFVAGDLQGQGRIEVPLHEARRGKMRPAAPSEPDSKSATTEYRLLRDWRLSQTRIALLEAVPVTGRQHQIRVHLRSVGSPLLFDDVYGRSTLTLLPGAPCCRLALHAHRLRAPHPSGNGELSVEAPLAADLEALSNWLSSSSSTA